MPSLEGGASYHSYMVIKLGNTEKIYFRSQILERPSIDEYWNIFGVPVLPENVIFTSFRTCHSEAYNTGTQKWSGIVQYSCTSIWDLKYTFSGNTIVMHTLACVAMLSTAFQLATTLSCIKYLYVLE